MRSMAGSGNIALYILLIFLVILTWILLVSPPLLPPPEDHRTCPACPELVEDEPQGYGDTSTPFTEVQDTTTVKNIDWDQELKKFNEDHEIAQDDPRVIELIREKFIIHPNNKPYNCTWAQENPSDKQLQAALPFLRNDSYGFYVEFGASNGEWLSNTFYLETHRGWNGILIEADQTNFLELVAKNRKAFMSPLCVSEKSYPHQLMSVEVEAEPDVDRYTGRRQQYPTSKVKWQCFPLYTILLAVNLTVVDFLSINNTNGSELDILSTVPFDKVIFKVVAVDMFHTAERAVPLINFMEKNGYKKIKDINFGSAHDYIFVHKSNSIQEVGLEATTTPTPITASTLTPTIT